MSSARVHSLDTLSDFQAALADFGAKAKESLISLAMEVRRVREWLEEQAKHWQMEVRRAEEAVVLARNELARKRMMRFGDAPVDTTDQERALARAKARLDHAETKVKATRSWIRQWPNELDDYEGRAKPLQFILEADLPKMLGYLERKADSLEAYTQTVVPDPPKKGVLK